VPLDEPTLAALDEWMTRSGPQRALLHPRLDRLADFLFTERGRRLTAFQLRRGLDDAAPAANHRNRETHRLQHNCHQGTRPRLRHTRQHPAQHQAAPARPQAIASAEAAWPAQDRGTPRVR
jgi:hypothetical protein